MKKMTIAVTLFWTLSLGSVSYGAIPIYSSLVGAPVNIVLDFSGDATLGDTSNKLRTRRNNGGYGYYEWTHVGGTGVPEFSHTHSLYSEFLSSTSDRDKFVENVWRMVADRFSMYNVNVTTDTSSKNDFSKTIRIVIDDNGDDWRLSTNANVRYDFSTNSGCKFGGFAAYNTVEGASTIGDSISYFEFRTAELAKSPPIVPPDNIAFVFVRGDMWIEDMWSSPCAAPGPLDQWPEIARFIAHTACHELTHHLGYNPDLGETASVLHPLRDAPTAGQRSGWSSVPALIAPPNNWTLAEKNHYSMEQNLGFRPGEEGDTLGTAEDLGSFGATGFTERDAIMHEQNDDDWFKVRLTDSQVSLKFKVRPKLLFKPLPVNGTRWHAVDVKISLADKNGNIIQTVNPSGETLSGWQPSITYDTKVSPELPNHLYYFLVEPAQNDGVRSHGDLGQYVITVDTIPSP